MLLINCAIDLILTWSANCVVKSSDIDQATTFVISDTNLYVPLVTLSTEDNAKLSQQSKPGFKKTINWNKNQSKVIMEAESPYLDYLKEKCTKENNIH